MKEIFKPNKTYAIFTTDEIYKSVLGAFKTYFSASKMYKILRCTLFVTDLTDIAEQERKIQTYHKTSNHRGIEETYLHLKRQYFFQI